MWILEDTVPAVPTKHWIFFYSESKATGSFQSASEVQVKVRKGSIESA